MQRVKVTVAVGICEEIDSNLGNIVMGCRAILAKERTVSSRGKIHILKVQSRLNASPSEI